MSRLPRLCVIEDDEIMGESLMDRFQLEDFEVEWCRSGAAALATLGRREYVAVISDVRLPDVDGGELFQSLRRDGAPLPPFIFITGYGSIERAVQLLKDGAHDYVTKPFDIDLLVGKVKAIAAVRASRPSGEATTRLGVSPAMQRIADSLPRLARHATTLLITGESGVGKEHVAQLYHQLTGGTDRPFVAVNCGALPESLMEAELFGYEKGAFTGAVRSKKGVFEQSDGGTLFLDEIGEMSLPMQVKLLRAVQEKRIVRLGAEAPVSVSFRLVCATHRDLRAMVETGCFREDLYYRINVIHLRIPPLRERREDIPWFVDRFLEEFRREHGGARRGIDPAAAQALLDYPWPGNLRELKHSVERACILSDASLLTADAFFEGEVAALAGGPAMASLSDYLAQCERNYLVQSLERSRWQIALCAADLGISRKNLWEKMKKLGIQAPSGGGQ